MIKDIQIGWPGLLNWGLTKTTFTQATTTNTLDPLKLIQGCDQFLSRKVGGGGAGSYVIYFLATS